MATKNFHTVSDEHGGVNVGTKFKMIKDHIATSLEISKDDFDLPPFNEKGGLVKFYNLFSDEMDKILEELSEALIA